MASPLSPRKRLQRRMMMKLMPALIRLYQRLEDDFAQRPDVFKAGPTSPERVDILRGAMKVEGVYQPPGFPRSVPQLIGSLRGIMASLKEVDDNPKKPRTAMAADDIAELEAFAKKAGALSVGYAEIPRRLIFKGKATLHSHAVVLTMEMDKERIDTAPSNAAGLAVHETYNHLGQVANQVARYLRSKGFSAQAGHPLNGLALYPPLGQAAHLGYRGLHGLLITPEMGPTVRLAAVYTSVENLPFPQGENPHQWIETFCDHCHLCERRCPPKAFLDKPQVHEDGRLTCIDDQKCLPFFATHDGCTICVAVCPFNKLGYDFLHRTVKDHGHAEAVRRVTA